MGKAALEGSPGRSTHPARNTRTKILAPAKGQEASPFGIPPPHFSQSSFFLPLSFYLPRTSAASLPVLRARRHKPQDPLQGTVTPRNPQPITQPAPRQRVRTHLLHLQLGRRLVLLQADGAESHQLPLGLSHPGQLRVGRLLVLAEGRGRAARSAAGSRDGARGKMGTVGGMGGPSRTDVLPGCVEAGRRRGHWGGRRFLTPCSHPAAAFGAQSITAALSITGAQRSRLSARPPHPQGEGHLYSTQLSVQAGADLLGSSSAERDWECWGTTG